MPKVILDFCLNHEGSLNIAKQMLEEAHKLGVWGVKLQMYNIDKLDTSWSKDYYKTRQLGNGKLRTLVQGCKYYGIKPIVTCFTPDSIRMAVDLGFEVIKIGSAEAHKASFYEALCNTMSGIEIFVSNGLTHTLDIQELLEEHKIYDYTIFDCVSKYPCSPSDYPEPILKNTSVNGISYHCKELKIDLLEKYEYIEVHYTLAHKIETKDDPVSYDYKEINELLTKLKNYKKRWGV